MQSQEASNLGEFITAAIGKGASDEFLATFLTRRGWPAEDVYTAIGNYWAVATGVTVPVRRGAGESSRDAFLYLLSFATLATWTTALGSMMFHFIDLWFVDPLARMAGYESVTWQMASIAVAFPIYMMVMRSILREAKDTERLQSGVRRWLTYIALLITAVAMICDLIASLNAFLEGELTSRFVLKAGTVMIICGAIFAWYFAFLRWNRVTQHAPRGAHIRPVAMAATAAVVAALCGGFAITDGPAKQRQFEADQTRVEDLRTIANAVKRWHDRAAAIHSIAQLPASLDELQAAGLLTNASHDPETKAPYEYRRLEGTQYEVCASFASASSEQNSGRFPQASEFWEHPRGHSCFVMNATETAPW